MSLKSFRQAVQAQLQTDLNTPMLAGKIDRPSEDEQIGCVWPEGVAEDGGHVNEEQMHLRARVFLRYQTPDAGQPVDPAPLEDMVEALQQSAQRSQTTSGPWFFRVTDVQVDVDLQGIEARILGYGPNPGV